MFLIEKKKKKKKKKKELWKIYRKKEGSMVTWMQDKMSHVQLGLGGIIQSTAKECSPPA